MVGQVTQVLAGFYDIEVEGISYRVRGSGNLREAGVAPVVGDFVEFTENEFLTKVLERKNSFERPKVANVDQVLIVTSLAEPRFSSYLLDKFLAIVESKNIDSVIVFTKSDIAEESHLEEYTSQGFTAFEISNNDEDSLKELSKVFKNKLSVLTGQTGVGKSSTINSLVKTNLETQEISKALGRGKHTTRVVKIIDWLNGRMIDTPGFSSLDFNMTKLEAARSFKDFKEMSPKCKFARSCLHHHEEDCEIKRNIGKQVSQSRYTNYLRLLEEAK